MVRDIKVWPLALRSASVAKCLSPNRTWEAIVLCAAFAVLSNATPLHAFSGNTVTALKVSSGAAVGDGVLVTFTASVTSGGGPVNVGFVTFCDASAKYCEDLAVLGTAAVNASGVATMKKVFAPGEHKVSAFYGPVGGTVSLPSSIQTIDIPIQVKALPLPVITKTGTSNPLAVQASMSVVGRTPFTGTFSIVQTQSHQALVAAPVGPSTTTSGFAPLIIYSPSVSDLPNTGIASVAGDFNGDGLPDLAVAVSTGFGDGTQAFAAVSLNDTSHPGELLPPESFYVSEGAFSLIAADFNGDGVLDLLTYVGDQGSALVLGDPAQPGQFGPPTYVSSSTVFQTAADLDQDGYPDLIGTNYSGVDVFYSSATEPGRFQNETVYPGGMGSVAVADVNGDGVLDLVAESSDPQHPGVAVLLGETAHPGHFLAPVIYPVSSGASPSQILVGDFNQDGHPDLAVLVPLEGVSIDMEILLNNPALPGQFSAGGIYTVSTDPYSSPRLTLGDFNGDGSLDLAADSGQSINFLYGNPKSPGQFLPVQNYPVTIPQDPSTGGEGFTSLTAADLNADGLTDLLSVLEFGEFNSDYPIAVLLGQQTQTMTVSFPSVAYDPLLSPLAQALYSGDENYDMIGSCDIDLAANEGAPVLYDVHADVGDVDAAVLWYWMGDVGAVDYGTTTALGSTTGWRRAAPSHLGGPSYIRLVGLKPATKYYYRIRAIGYFSGCSHWTTTSPIESFTTAK